MKNAPDYYPPSPRKVPEDLTEPSVPFRNQMNVFGFALLLFFVLYFGIILLLCAGILFCVTRPGVEVAGQGNAWNVWRWILAAALCVPLAVLIKNLFSRQTAEKGYEVEVHEEDNPRLFKFLECVCAETGAPMPDRVLIDFSVNAAASSEVTFLSLFRPPERTLILGLGLINSINMTEFKTLLAHEFGHFSQHSMPSAPYVYLATRVVYNILHGTGFGLDKILEGIFIFMVKLDLALSREMEFHADLVAVSVAGSDAVPQLLYKCYWAEACLQQTIADLDTAREHKLYSTDVFYHQRQAGKYLRKRAKNPDLGKPPEPFEDRRRTYQLFKPEEDQQAHMWERHPSNYDRELNAKACYIRTDFDETSPWMLFGDREGLRRKVSRQFYRQIFRVKADRVDWSSPDAVQDFLDEEYAETTFDEDRYGILYNHRNLQPLDLRGLRTVCEKSPHTPEELLTSLRSLYTPPVKRFGAVYQRHYEELQLLTAIKKRWFEPEDKRFKMRGEKFHVREVKGLLRDVEKELEADNTWLRHFDTKVFVTYFELASQLDGKLAEELYQRYSFHFVIQGMWSILEEHRSPMGFMFELLNSVSGTQLDEDFFHFIIEICRQAYDAVKTVLDEAETVFFPQLANMPAGKPMRPFLLKGRLVEKPTHFDTHLSSKWLVNFANQFGDVQKRLNRLHFKSLGNILALQESIGDKAEKKWKLPSGTAEKSAAGGPARS